MPHERGLMPVPPSEFLLPCFADPKVRFCRARQLLAQPINGNLS